MLCFLLVPGLILSCCQTRSNFLVNLQASFQWIFGLAYRPSHDNIIGARFYGFISAERSFLIILCFFPGATYASGTGEEAKDDQKRTLSAYEAIKAGADYIVVGRPIRKAKDPLEACLQINQEITAGLAAR